MRNEGVNLLFFSGNSVCWVSPFRESSSGEPNRIIFRGGPYGGDYKYATDREAQTRSVPASRPGRGLPDGRKKRRPRQRRRRLGLHNAGPLDLRRDPE